jgi:hypothetical protein
LTQANPPSQHGNRMTYNRLKLYAVAVAGVFLFGGIVVLDMLNPGMMNPALALAASLGLAVCGVGVLALRPRKKRTLPHDAPGKDLTAVLEERRRLAEEAARRGPRLPPE